MNERFIAQTQAFLSYVIISGYFVLKILQGFGVIADSGADLKEVVMIVAFYWFQRQRQENKPDA